MFRWYHAIGVPLKQAYGQTEASGICAVHPDGEVRYDSVGRPLPGVELRISDSGEILIRGQLCSGYFENPEATARALRDGWLHGDHGLLDEHGHLIVVDRLNDLMRLQDGTPLAPPISGEQAEVQPVHQRGGGLRQRPPIRGCAVEHRFRCLRQVGRAQGLPFTTYVDLSQRPEIARLCVSEVERANADLPRNLRIRRFVVLYKELDPDDDEITRPARSAAPSISATPE